MPTRIERTRPAAALVLRVLVSLLPPAASGCGGDLPGVAPAPAFVEPPLMPPPRPAAAVNRRGPRHPPVVPQTFDPAALRAR